MAIGALILLVSGLLVCAHVTWPALYIVKVAAHAGVIFAGAICLVALGEKIAGARRFAMPSLCLFLITATGTLLSARHGWASTTLVLAVYGALCIGEGFRTRAEQHRLPS
jgi:hypothetical protein